jgi:hypothetical protein
MKASGIMAPLGDAWQALVAAVKLLNSKLTGIKSTTLKQQLHAIHAKANILAESFGHSRSEVDLHTWLKLQQTMCVCKCIPDTQHQQTRTALRRPDDLTTLTGFSPSGSSDQQTVSGSSASRQRSTAAADDVCEYSNVVIAVRRCTDEVISPPRDALATVLTL